MVLSAMQVLLLLASPLQAKPVITEERVYYSFKAITRNEIWQQIKLNSPNGEVEKAGQHLINVAMTQTQMGARFRYDVSLTQCKLVDIRPTLHITIHMPHWENSWQADPRLVDNWNGYVRMVSNHEDVHKQYAIKMVEEYERRLHALGMFKRCKDLKAAVQKTRKEVVGQFNAENAWFDAKERVYRNGLQWF